MKDKSDTWLTPLPLIQALGEFDLDPCTPIDMPWVTAAKRYTIMDDGLAQLWQGRVWMNPPYSDLLPWILKISNHRNGIVLVPLKTGTQAFQRHVFPKADSIFYFEGRLTFCNTLGHPTKRAPFDVCLIAYGENNCEAIAESGFKGNHQPLNKVGVLVIGWDMGPWRIIVRQALIRIDKPAELDKIYEEVVSIAEEKVKRNQHFKAKIRQTLQHHFKRVARGTYSR